MVVIELLGCLVFDTPRTPRGQELNLDGYSLFSLMTLTAAISDRG